MHARALNQEERIVVDYSDDYEEEEDGPCSEEETTTRAAGETPEISCALVHLQALKSGQNRNRDWSRINLKDDCLSCRLVSRFDSLTDPNAETFDRIAAMPFMLQVHYFIADVCMFILRWNSMCAGKACTRLHTWKKVIRDELIKIFVIDQPICWYFRQKFGQCSLCSRCVLYCWCCFLSLVDSLRWNSSDISRFSPRIDRIFPGEALNPFFGAQDEGFSEFRFW